MSRTSDGHELEQIAHLDPAPAALIEILLRDFGHTIEETTGLTYECFQLHLIFDEVSSPAKGGFKSWVAHRLC